DKVDILVAELQKIKFLGEPYGFKTLPGFEPGEGFPVAFQKEMGEWDTWKESIIKIFDREHGLVWLPEDYDYIDRNNVIVIEMMEACFEDLQPVCDILQEITGDEYTGDYEPL